MLIDKYELYMLNDFCVLFILFLNLFNKKMDNLSLPYAENHPHGCHFYVHYTKYLSSYITQYYPCFSFLFCLQWCYASGNFKLVFSSMFFLFHQMRCKHKIKKCSNYKFHVLQNIQRCLSSVVRILKIILDSKMWSVYCPNFISLKTTLRSIQSSELGNIAFNNIAL